MTMQNHTVIIVILSLSIFVQAAAALMAFRLISGPGRRWTWSLIATALLLMAARRAVPLYHLVVGDRSYPPDLLNECIGLALSIIMVAGITYMFPAFNRWKGTSPRHLGRRGPAGRNNGNEAKG